MAHTHDSRAPFSAPDTFAFNVADGYRAVVPHLRERPGSEVLVACHGTPSIALYAAQAAVAFGAETIFASDDAEVLRKAGEIGASPVRTDFVTRSGRWPIVVDCGTRVEGLQYSIASTAPEGILHNVSYYATPPRVPLPLGKLYTLGITFHIGRVHSAALRAMRPAEYAAERRSGDLHECAAVADHSTRCRIRGLAQGRAAGSRRCVTHATGNRRTGPATRSSDDAHPHGSMRPSRRLGRGGTGPGKTGARTGTS